MYAICDKFTGKPICEPHETETDAWVGAINRKLTTQGWMNGQTVEFIHSGYEVREVAE